MTAPQLADIVPFADIIPTVEWQVAGDCNYDCTYCIQSKAFRQGQPDRALVDAIVKGLSGLPGAWEIKMSGGEPFAAKLFLDAIVPGLVAETPHTISVLTNFSAPVRSLERFAELTGDRLRITSASLHLESVSAEEFIDKAVAYREVRARHNPHATFVVNSVLVPGTLRRLATVKAQVEAAGFRWFPQIMKLKHGVYPYGPDDLARIAELTGDSRDPRVVNRAPSYRGLHCEAGAWYFVLDRMGEAWSCRTAKRHGDGRLGSVVDGSFARRLTGGLCSYDICPCTVPANRGIVRLGVPA